MEVVSLKFLLKPDLVPNTLITQYDKSKEFCFNFLHISSFEYYGTLVCNQYGMGFCILPLIIVRYLDTQLVVTQESCMGSDLKPFLVLECFILLLQSCQCFLRTFCTAFTPTFTWLGVNRFVSTIKTTQKNQEQL